MSTWGKQGVEPCGPGPFITFTRTVVEKKPWHKLRGLERVQPHEQAVWAQERYRFAPYQYQERDLVKRVGGLGTLKAEEREAILRSENGHTKGIFNKQEQGQQRDYEGARVEALGNSWFLPVAAWLLQQLFAEVDPQVPRRALAEVVARCCPSRYRLVSMHAAQQQRGQAAQELAEHLFKSADHTGGLLR